MPFVPMSDLPNNSAAPAAPVAAAAGAQAPATGQTLTPAANPSAEQLLRQADTISQSLNEAKQREAQLLAKLKALEDDNTQTKQRWEAYKAQYASEQKPKADEYAKAFKEAAESQGQTIDEQSMKAIYATFSDPDYKHRADQMWAQHQHQLKVAASRKAEQEELRALKEKSQKLEEQLSKATQIMQSGMRSSIVDAVSHDNDTVDAATVSVGASGRAASSAVARQLNAGECMAVKAAVPELPFLKECGFSGGFSVTASNAATGEPEYMAMRATVKAAPNHRLKFDPKTKEPNFPNSMANWFPHIWGYMTSPECGLVDAEVGHMTHITDSKKWPTKEQRVDTQFAGAIGLQVHETQ